MFTKIDKALISGAVSFASLVALKLFGFELDVATQASIVSVLTMALTWIVPNKA